MGEHAHHVALSDAVGGFAPIGLEELDRRAALQRRTDRKYLLPRARLELLGELRDDHEALEIEGRRLAAYDSVYFDTPDLRCYADHVADRKPRFKIRSRLYADSGICSLEVKIAREDGETDKHHLDYAERDHGTLTPEAREFVAETLGDRAPANLDAKLRTAFRRATLAARRGSERITIDADLRLERPDGTTVRLRDDLVLVETKSADGDAAFDRLMASAGVDEVSLSKYKTGIGLLLADDADADAGPAARCFSEEG